MKFETSREDLLKPLQQIIGVVERRQTLPVLANVLSVVEDGQLLLTTTDLEVELSARAELSNCEPGAVTLPARKLYDILRALPEDASVALGTDGAKAVLRSGRSRFVLGTLPAAGFPSLSDLAFDVELSAPQSVLKRMVERTHFAMAQQDVRYYLNGLLLDIDGAKVRAVATDGHRLAFAEAVIEPDVSVTQQVIVPRKGVQELLRLLGDDESEATLEIAANHIRLAIVGTRLTSKLIDGRFPDYERVIPPEGERIITTDRGVLRAALTRAAILSGDKYRGVRLEARDFTLRIEAHNPEHEEAREEIEVSYSGPPLEIGFNVNYLLDALGALSGELVKLTVGDDGNSCLIQSVDDDGCKYVVMPVRL